jgi:hypothetical protein
MPFTTLIVFLTPLADDIFEENLCELGNRNNM